MWYAITLEKKYADAILEGRKLMELRTRIPKGIGSKDYIVVCVKGTKGKIACWFSIESVAECSPLIMWQRNSHVLCIDKTDYDAYCKGHSVVYGLRIHAVYSTLMDLCVDDFGLPKAPQWFSVVNDYPKRLLAGSTFKR